METSNKTLRSFLPYEELVAGFNTFGLRMSLGNKENTIQSSSDLLKNLPTRHMPSHRASCLHQ